MIAAEKGNESDMSARAGAAHADVNRATSLVARFQGAQTVKRQLDRGALDAQPFMRDQGAVAVADPLHRGRDLHLPLGPRFQVAKHAAGGFDLLCVASVHRTGPWAIDITKRQKTRGRTRRSHSKRVHCNQKGTSVEQAVAAIGL